MSGKSTFAKACEVLPLAFQGMTVCISESLYLQYFRRNVYLQTNLSCHCKCSALFSLQKYVLTHNFIHLIKNVPLFVKLLFFFLTN